MQNEVSKYRKAYCTDCGGDRNCDVRGHHRKIENVADGAIFFVTEFYILQCRGCENLFVQKVESNSEDVQSDYAPDGSTISESIETYTYWPSKSNRDKPEWLDDLQFEIEKSQTLFHAMTEMYGALDAGLQRLAAIGIRACFDVASEMLSVPEEYSFEKKIQELVKRGKLTDLDKGRIDVLVEAGNASAHRAWGPDAKQLQLLAEILEHFIENAFIIPLRTARLNDEAAKLKPKVPSRRKLQKSDSHTK